MRAIIALQNGTQMQTSACPKEGNKQIKGEIMVTTNQCEICRYGGHGEKCCKAQGGIPKYIYGEKCPLYAMSAQAFMQRVSHTQRRIVQMEERAAHYRDMAKRITARLGGVRVSGSPGGSRMEENMDAFMDICRDIEREARCLREYLAQANEVISRIADVREREILELRYLSGYDFEDIARRLFLSERTVRRIHVKALEHVQREMDVIEYAQHRPGWNPKPHPSRLTAPPPGNSHSRHTAPCDF